jgi:hypothetical protein
MGVDLKRISMATRDELLAALTGRYREASRAEKGRLLGEFAELTGYHRKHAERLLRGLGTRDRSKARPARRIYDDAVREVLIVLWEASDRICGKRLKPLIPMLISAMERHGHLALDAEIRVRLMSISAATIDRALASARAQASLRGRRRARAVPAIRRSIPVRTFADWNDPAPGFFEADLVAHGGPTARGSFLQTLVMTDVATGWTECAPLLFREQELLGEVLSVLRAAAPIPVLGLDTDNDSVFMNETIKSWCEAANVVFTRSRPYRKNDQAHVEQKNGAIVRRMVGYRRLEGLSAAEVLAGLYRPMRLFVNFFQPSFKLAEKQREGAQVRKRYHDPLTPHRRLIADPRVPQAVKDKLDALYLGLDPVSLLNDIRSAQRRLVEIADSLPASDPMNGTEPPLEAFLAGLRLAWKEGEVRPTAQAKATKPRGRRRPDPLKDVTAELLAWFDADPSVSGGELLEKLRIAYPGVYPSGLLRTVQRRLKVWRAERATILVFGRPEGQGAEFSRDALRDLKASRVAGELH